MKKYYHLFRIKHYFKNLIIFSPILFIEKKIDDYEILNLFNVFLVFCLVASIVYIYNDIQDIHSDKNHPTKKKTKPLVNGQVSQGEAYKWLLVLILSSICFLYFNQKLIIIFLSYLLINFFYTHIFKKVIFLDILVLSSNYVIRVLAGCISLNVPLSYWMGATIFSGALFLSSLKRKQELFLYGTKSRKVLKLYSVKWLRFLTNFTAILSIIFYCSYVVSVNQKLVITVPLVIYAIFRYNKLSSNKNFSDSPVDEIVNDKQNIMIIFLWIIFVVGAKLY